MFEKKGKYFFLKLHLGAKINLAIASTSGSPFQKLAWTSGGLSGTYSLRNNSIRVSSGVNYMTNGSDKNSVQIVGGKLGCDWDIISNLVFSAKSNIRLNRVKANKDDGIDNDNDGKVDNSGEIWSTSNSGLVFSLNYRF